MRLCYIAGPFRHPDPDRMTAHTRTAQEAVGQLAGLGWAGYCPHANIGHAYGDLDETLAADINTTFLERCDAILLLPNWWNSPGSRHELQQARDLGLHVFHSISEVALCRP